MSTSLVMTVERVKNILSQNGQVIVSEGRNKNNQATVLTVGNGCIINCWDSGKVNTQGKNTVEIDQLLTGKIATPTLNKKVFVVYGHDNNARTQLEAMLRRWDLEPLIIDQLASKGQTIIEKLEEYTGQANFGIVLATPDDVGYAKDREDDKKFRARQNVVLELGMLLAKIGRSKVAILLSQADKMERPSDIDGLIYIPFSNNVEEGKVSLAKELKRNGYTIDIENLGFGLSYAVEESSCFHLPKIPLNKQL